LSRAQVSVLTGNNIIRLLNNLLTLGQDQLDVAGVGHVGVDLWFWSAGPLHTVSFSPGFGVQHTRPWAR
jgi:hypothetical protein